jgi:hypothetical protein
VALGAYAWYSASTYTSGSSVWSDSSGNDWTAAASGTWLVENEPGNGATGNVSYVAGGVNSWISFAELWSTFTVCVISRYTGGWMDRLLSGRNGNWFLGHAQARAGVFLTGERGWVFDYNQDISSRLGISKHNWVYICGSSSLTYVNGVRMGGGGEPPLLVNINLPGPYWTNSDFGIAELILWDRQLSEAEIIAVQAYQAQLLSPPPPPPSPSPPPPPSSPPVGGLPAAIFTVMSTATLGGFTAATFSTAAQGAFVSATASALVVASNAVSITSVTNAGSRRLLQGGGGVAVGFSVIVTSPAAAAAVSSGITAVAANPDAFAATLSSSLQKAGVDVVVTVAVSLRVIDR